MTHSHSHVPKNGHLGAKHQWRLAASFLMILSFFLVELIFGILSGSLSLLSDAGHMAADVVSLGAALIATRIALSTKITERKTYGSYRAEIFASGLAALLMLAVAAYVVFEAFERIGQQIEISTFQMLIVGALGLIVNIISMFVLKAGAVESLNVKGAYLEVVSDTAGSIGVIVASILISVTQNYIWDTVVALAIGIFVAVRAIILGREVFAVLGQHTPKNVNLQQITDDLTKIRCVEDVHDLHVWTLTSGMNVATVHLATAENADSMLVLNLAQELLQKEFAIEHATIQVEKTKQEACSRLGW